MRERFPSDSDPAIRKAYRLQKRNAGRRGIAWEFTFAEWLKVWTDSGRLPERGVHVGEFCMCRKGDTGPYSESNVEIRDTNANRSEAHETAPFLSRKGRIGGIRGIGGGRGVRKNRRGDTWRAEFRNQHVGNFQTERLARIGYLESVTAYIASIGRDVPEKFTDELKSLREQCYGAAPTG